MELIMAPVTLVNAASVTIATHSGCNLPYPARSFVAEVAWTVTTDTGSAAISGLVLGLEGSVSGTSYEALDTATQLSAAQLTAKYALLKYIDKPCSHIRVNVTAVTLTGTTGINLLTVKVLPMR